MEFNRFDIVEAWYLALCHCHSGQNSREYRRLSKMSKYFRPAVFLSEDTLSENGRMIYDNACQKLLAR